MHIEEVNYQHGDVTLHGFVAYSASITEPQPVVMVMPDWSGRNVFACEKAKMLASLGYIGFAVDMYGDGKIGETTEQKAALMQPLMQDRALMRSRLLAHLQKARKLPFADPQKIAAIGFCFGGLCVLDLVRSGADLLAVVSFHGLLTAPEHLETHPVSAKILVLHGYDDPMVKPDDVNAFCREMTEAGADWQVHMYSHTQHAFTNPQAHDKAMGTVYNPLAEARSLQAMDGFLLEVFASK